MPLVFLSLFLTMVFMGEGKNAADVVVAQGWMPTKDGEDTWYSGRKPDGSEKSKGSEGTVVDTFSLDCPSESGVLPGV